MATPVMLMAALATLFAVPVNARVKFLRDADAEALTETVSALLRTEVKSIWAAGVAQERMARLETALAPMYNALPKNENGKLGVPVVRYALHRLFEKTNSWFIKGLHPNAGGGSSSSSDDPFGFGLVAPEAVQGMISKLEGHGITLHELVVLAAVIEANIHKEVVNNVDDLYTAFNLKTDGELNETQLALITDAYLTIYISGSNFSQVTTEDIAADTTFMVENTKDWKENQEWMQEARKRVLTEKKLCTEGKCKHDYNTTLSITEAMVEKYAHFNDGGCSRLKSKLLRFEERKTGRVPLVDFYKEGLAGVWQFNEKREYLRALGALDESVKDKPRVIVPNYVNSWVNCLFSSTFYNVCCRNECEDIMGYLEKEVAAPTAHPDTILSFIKKLPADLVREELSVSDLLDQRLRKIAARHHGSVPLHGRLFAQWMHHVFPRSCPYPREVGTSNPQTPEDWMMDTGHSDIKASHEEMTHFINNVEIVVERGDGDDKDDSPDADLPWSDEEELLVIRPQQPSSTPTSYLEQAIVFGEGVASVAVVLAVFLAAKLVAQRKWEMRMVKAKEISMGFCQEA